jgi:hypothetical protein
MLLAPGLSLLLLLAQQGVAPAPPEGAQISGVIVDADSRAPPRGVRVLRFIEAPSPPPPAMRGPHVLMTDRSGRFTFDRLTTGTFRIDATKAGYVRPTDLNERPIFSVTADQHVDRTRRNRNKRLPRTITVDNEDVSDIRMVVRLSTD